MKVLAIILLALVLGQNGKAPETAVVSAENAKPIKEMASEVEKGQWAVRALSAELQLAQKRLEEQRRQLSDLMSEAAQKAGIPKEQLANYDVIEDGGGFKFTRKKS